MMDQLLVNVGVLAAIYVLFALGMSLAWGVLGVLNLAHGAILLFSVYIASLLGAAVSLPLPALVAAGALIGGVSSLVLELLVFRRIRSSRGDEEERELRVVIASLGAATMLTAIVAFGTAGAPFSIPSSFTTEVFRWGVRITNLQIVIIVVGLGLSLVLGIWLRTTRTGRAIRAIASDPETASLMGISERRLGAATMFTAGALAGVAGTLLVVYLGGIDPHSSAGLLTTAFAIIVVGGVGSIAGAAVGAVLLALLETLLITYTDGLWAPAAAFVLIIVIILLRPQGLFATSSRKVDRA